MVKLWWVGTGTVRNATVVDESTINKTVSFGLKVSESFLLQVSQVSIIKSSFIY